MLISESRVKAIINEEIKKMIMEGEIEEGWFSDKVSNLGKKFVGGAARMTGLTSSELANQEKAAEAERQQGEFMSGVKANTAMAQKVESLVSDSIGHLAEIDKILEEISDLTNSETATNKVLAMSDQLYRELEAMKMKVLRYQFESKNRKFRR